MCKSRVTFSCTCPCPEGRWAPLPQEPLARALTRPWSQPTGSKAGAAATAPGPPCEASLDCEGSHARRWEPRGGPGGGAGTPAWRVGGPGGRGSLEPALGRTGETRAVRRRARAERAPGVGVRRTGRWLSAAPEQVGGHQPRSKARPVRGQQERLGRP